MTPSCYRGAFVLLLSLGFASLSPASRLDDPSDRPKREAERLFQIEQMRIAASGRLIEVDDEIAAYLRAGFNTVVLYDTEESSGTGVGLLKSEQRIAFEVGFARAPGLQILLGKATEPVTP